MERLSALLPAFASCKVVADGPAAANVDRLPAGELELIARAAPRSPTGGDTRQRHLRLGRLAAHAAIDELVARGLAPRESAARSILGGPRGEPLWPAGVTGSITHTGDRAAAAVAPAARCHALGIDAEARDRRITPAVIPRVALPGEQAWLADGGGDDARLRLMLLFCAKEAVFKACYPLSGVSLDFADAELRWSAARSSFTCTLLRAAGPHHPAGCTFPVRCSAGQRFVVAAVCLEG